MGAGLGWFSPRSVFGPRLDELIGKIHEITGPSGAAFPLAVSPLENERKEHVLHYAIVSGHIPIHCDPRNVHQREQALWHFVLEAENRPILLIHPADRESSQNILIPRKGQNVKQAFAAIELEAGAAVHFDITKHWHGITQYPTGDLVPELPAATLIQLPHIDGRDIGFALKEAKRLMKLDDRLAEFLD